jgi:predicted ATPase
MGTRLSRITLRGFKTLRELQDFEPGPVTILIGPNGGGKTNFISFFRMLSRRLRLIAEGLLILSV